MTDILDTIDQALGCQQCGEALDASPSDMYCSEDCSEEAAAEITCREVGDSWAPLDWSIDDAPEGPFSWLPAPVYDWRLPRSTGDLDEDITRWSYAQSIATTDSQRAACVERGMDLTRRLNERARERDRRGAAGATVGFARSVGTEPLTRVEEWDAAFRVSELTDLEFSQFVGEPSGYMRAEFSAAFARSGGFVLRGRYVPAPRVQLNFEGLELTEEECREVPRVLGNCHIGGRVTILRRNAGRREAADTNLGTWMVTGISRDEHTITYIGERVCAPT